MSQRRYVVEVRHTSGRLVAQLGDGSWLAFDGFYFASARAAKRRADDWNATEFPSVLTACVCPVEDQRPQGGANTVGPPLTPHELALAIEAEENET